MFGHDMSWASFHVLEVMSSSKYLQKRAGYLGAVQSFRPDTEVLMLATNLLKKVANMEGPGFSTLLTDPPGYHVVFNPYNCITSCRITTHHQFLIGHVTALRPLAKVVSFESKYSEKNHRFALPARLGLP